MLNRWFHRVVLTRSWLTFFVMGASFFAFGVGTYNIWALFRANGEFIAAYGWQALMEGAGQQLAELLLTSYLSMAAYVVFKTCEHRLVHALTDPETAGRFADAGPASGAGRDAGG